MSNVARTFYQISPDVLGRLYLDEIDFRGLYFWHQDAIEQDEAQRKEQEKAQRGT